MWKFGRRSVLRANTRTREMHVVPRCSVHSILVQSLSPVDRMCEGPVNLATSIHMVSLTEFMSAVETDGLIHGM